MVSFNYFTLNTFNLTFQVLRLSKITELKFYLYAYMHTHPHISKPPLDMEQLYV